MPYSSVALVTSEIEQDVTVGEQDTVAAVDIFGITPDGELAYRETDSIPGPISYGLMRPASIAEIPGGWSPMVSVWPAALGWMDCGRRCNTCSRTWNLLSLLSLGWGQMWAPWPVHGSR